ncbi:MAG: 4Fe-4S ferredoxin [Syntrophobacterales bacterium]|nr:MAG: 4Fe-4S ferredoxin [Syntrophobacterales bacterium]
MEKRVIKKNALAGIIKNISNDMLVYAPVQEEDNVLFKVLEAGMEPLVTYANPKNAPKNFFFPQTETMMKYFRTERGKELSDVVEEMPDAVLFGVRPCDARSFVLLDNIFDDPKYRDPYYVERREKTTIVSMACVHPPYTTCFCTSVGGHPMASEGSDIVITDLGDDYLAEFLTPKGEKLLEKMGDLGAADESLDAKKIELSKNAEKEITSHIPGREIKPWLDENFESPFWDTLYRSCLACGTCTYLCPTCHCFDITDEVKGDGGRRIRSWDSCMSWLFTMETSGHNPRTSQKERWRQRLMHKFKYFVDNFDAIACVGCGRCVINCPVNIDIRKIVTDISKL